MPDPIDQPVAPEVEAPPVVPGTEALTEPVVPESRETIPFKWGRDSREVDAETAKSMAEELGTSVEALRTWVQMGRNAADIYSETRRRDAELARREAEIEAKAKTFQERLDQRTGPPTNGKRPSITEDPVAFWNSVDARLDKLNEIEEVKRELAETKAQIVQREQAKSDEQLENTFVKEHQSLMDEYKKRELPYVDLQTIAQTLDRFVTEIPEDMSIRELIDMGYRIITWDRVGKAQAQAEQKRLRMPRAKLEIPAGATGGAETGGDGAPPAGESLEQRRARLHRQVGGLTFGDLVDR